MLSVFSICIFLGLRSMALKDENDRKPWLQKNASQLKEKKISCAFKEMLWWYSGQHFCSDRNTTKLPTLYISLQYIVKIQRPWKTIVTYIFWKKLSLNTG